MNWLLIFTPHRMIDLYLGLFFIVLIFSSIIIGFWKYSNSNKKIPLSWKLERFIFISPKNWHKYQETMKSGATISNESYSMLIDTDWLRINFYFYRLPIYCEAISLPDRGDLVLQFINEYFFQLLNNPLILITVS